MITLKANAPRPPWRRVLSILQGYTFTARSSGASQHMGGVHNCTPSQWMDSVQLCMIGLNSLLWHLVLTCMPIQTALCCIETSMRSCIWSHMVVHCAVCLILRPVCAITWLCSVQCNALRPHIRPELDRNPWLCNLHGCYPVGCGQGHLCLARYWSEFLFLLPHSTNVYGLKQEWMFCAHRDIESYINKH